MSSSICPACNGSKRTKTIGTFSMPCPYCNGKGTIDSVEFDRICKLANVKPDSLQTNLFITEEGTENANKQN